MKNSKKILSMLLLTLLIFSVILTGCSPKATAIPADSSSPLPVKMIELKLGHVSNTSHPYHIAAEKVAKEVFEKTNGAVKINIFPSNQLGEQREMNEGVKTGAIDIVLTSSAVLAAFAPKVQVIDLPFIFESRAHAYKVFDGPISKKIFAGVESVGTVVAVWENGVRDMWTSSRAIKTPTDMDGMKIRVMENKVYVEMIKLLGGNPTPMAYGELYTALSQKTVDGAEGPVANFYTERFYEVLDYVTMTEHSYSPSIVLLNNDLATKIGAENYEILVETIQENTKFQRDLAISEEKAKIEILIKEGIEINTLTAEEKQQFVVTVKPVWDMFVDVVGQDLIDEIVQAK